jgi:hypothetical protein
MRDYDSLAVMGAQLSHVTPCLLEVYSGGDLVVWQGNIERQLQAMAEKAANVGNRDYERLIKQFLAQWKENALTGSLNIDTLQKLKLSAEWAAEYPWTFNNYFSVLRDQLRKVIAVTGEELPVMPVQPEKNKKGPGKTAARMDTERKTTSTFGPEEEEGDLEKPADELAEKPEAVAADIQADIDAATKGT